MATARPTASPTPKLRRQYSAEEKARLLAAARAPGASVAQIAREHGINDNLLFKWLRRERQALLPAPVPALLPITLAEEPTAISTAVVSTTPSAITVECRRGTVRLEGAPEPDLVRLVLEMLTR
jgi:transposase